MRRLAQKWIRWFDLHARDLPWRRTRDPYADLDFRNHAATDAGQNGHSLLRAVDAGAADAGADFARARPERVLKLWEGLGYYRRVRLAQAAARLIMEKHSGRFPESFDEVLALPGVGRYTAGAICSIAFNQPAPILDGNVIRVL
jgi:A/G-specific adenine glycosylase